MFTYFTPNELFNNLIFPLIVNLVPVILSYFLFEPIIGLLKKTKKYLTYCISCNNISKRAGSGGKCFPHFFYV